MKLREILIAIELGFGKGINVVRLLDEQVQAIPKKVKPDLKPQIPWFEDLNFQIHAT